MVIKRVCGWCGCSMPPKECESMPHQSIEEPISHSICPGCLEKVLADIKSITAVTSNPNK